MNTVTRVTYQNFLGAGNHPIVIDLNKHQSTLIIGKNGAGKSTMTEAVCFGWFGRPLRKVNKPALVNTINKRDCLVELEWKSASGNTYCVRRGIKPSIFEIIENGNLLPQPANMDDYQTTLESIIGLNYKAFMQVVVLGSASYVPFMRLGSAARREIIEDLLDIEVFSQMNALAKDDLTELKTAIEVCTAKRKSVGEQLKMAEQFTAHLEEQRKQSLATTIAEMDRVAEELAALQTEIQAKRIDLSAYDTVRKQLTEAQQKRQDYEKKLVLIESHNRKTTSERAFYEEHDNCPECEQTITEEFKQARFTAIAEKETAATKASAQCQAFADKWRRTEKSCQDALVGADRLKQDIYGLEAKEPLMLKRWQELEREQRRLKHPQPQQTVDLNALNAELIALKSEHDDLAKKRVVLDAATLLLKDNGIKTRVIRHYLPIINKAINHYLTAMDFPVLFTFNEQFEEEIKSRYQDELGYESFSEGEKKRIDLALLLTWRSVARLKNSASTNLLILDEVFDSSLDAAGTEEFLKIIAGLESDTNVFVISHKADQLVDKFAHTIVFEKTRGFSQVK